MTGPLDPGPLDPSRGPLELHLVAAALRSDAPDVASLVRVLTATLGDALPEGMVEVERDRSLGDRLAGRPGTPVAVRVHGTDRELELRSGRTGPVGEVRQVVRGVVLSRRTVPLHEWVAALAAELTALADTSAAARDALGRMLGTT